VTTTASEADVLVRAAPTGREAARARFPARPVPAAWPATRQSRGQVQERLTRAPFAAGNAHTEKIRRRGLTFLLDWLEEQPGTTWQERWLATGADAAGAAWRNGPARWLREQGLSADWRLDALASALHGLISADVVRPALGWLVAKATGPGSLVRHLARARDPEGFARLKALCDADPHVSAISGSHTLYRAAEIAAAKGGGLADITVGDVLELLDTELGTLAGVSGDVAVSYRLLHAMGVFGQDAPPTLREIRSVGQRTPEELIGRYQLKCRPVRDLLVDYLRERQPRLDYGSLKSLAYHLGMLFWQDLERHNPGISSLHLPAEVADAWKQRLRTKPKMITTPGGERTRTLVPRLNYWECLIPVRAFYLDLAQWAAGDPARWGPWVAPCPIREEETSRRKARRHRKSRMDARTRERLPVLPVLIQTVGQRRAAAQELLEAARQAQHGETFTAAGQTLTRVVTRHGTAVGKVWAADPQTGKRRDLTFEEEQAFWTWAIVEVLRSTGVRVEELLEISHHSLVQYRLPTTGELVPLLQIAPSKTDAERLLVVSPELADVFSAIIRRVCGSTGEVPCIAAYDRHERVWLAPAPLLFQRRFGAENRRLSPDAARDLLASALEKTGLVDPADGGPLRYTPHDFRRLFITEAIMSGLPPHIAQVIVGHRDINVTISYKAVYPEEAIQAHLAFLARRRALRPTDEYRVPTDEEWQEFLGHFERRKVATGLCGRAFGTPCIHEHSCLRCSMHWPDPAQRHRIAEIRDNLIARIAEAEHEGWLGEVEGLKISLAGAEDKLAQIDRRSQVRATVSLGMPGVRNAATRKEPS
jgi:Phage integrase family